MSEDPTPSSRLFPKQRLTVLSLHDRQSPEAILIRERKRVDQQTVQRIVDCEADELLPRLLQAVQDAEAGTRILALAEWSGSERENELRGLLQKFADLGSVQ